MTPRPDADSGPTDRLSAYLQDIAGALAAASTEREIIEIVLTPAVEALGAVAGIVLLVDQSDQQIKIAGSQGYEAGPPTVWQTGSVDDHVLISDILRMKEAMYFEEVGALKIAYPDLERRTTGLAAVANAALPMFLDSRPFGIIVLDFTELHHFTPEERRFLTILASQCAVAMGRAEAIRTLEAKVADRTRQLEEERSALAAFVAFTEAVGSESDVQLLVQQAITLLVDTCGVDAMYLERDGELFKATAWNPQFEPILLACLRSGFPLKQSSLALLLREDTAAFVDHWDAERQRVEESAYLQAVAGYPIFQADTMDSVLLMGARGSAVWTEREKGIFRAVGRSLDLALDRTHQTRTITAQRDALEARTQELAASTQELQAFSYSVSHDLRTPVRHMLGFLQLAQRSLDGKLDDRTRRYLDVVEQAGTEMNTLIDAMLDLSRAVQEPLRPTTVDLNMVMAQLQEALVPDLLSRPVQWEVAPLPSVHGDRDALKHVLSQLTENALKFTRTRDPAIIKVWAEDQGKSWKVSVGTTGWDSMPAIRSGCSTCSSGCTPLRRRPARGWGWRRSGG